MCLEACLWLPRAGGKPSTLHRSLAGCPDAPHCPSGEIFLPNSAEKVHFPDLSVFLTSETELSIFNLLNYLLGQYTVLLHRRC